MTVEPDPEVPTSGRVVRWIAFGLGMVLLAAVITLAVADSSARAFLITAAGILAMIILGVTFGGRGTPNVSAVSSRSAQAPPSGPPPASPPAAPARSADPGGGEEGGP